MESIPLPDEAPARVLVAPYAEAATGRYTRGRFAVRGGPLVTVVDPLPRWSDAAVIAAGRAA
jgi:hypothetical protein